MSFYICEVNNANNISYILFKQYQNNIIQILYKIILYKK